MIRLNYRPMCREIWSKVSKEVSRSASLNGWDPPSWGIHDPSFSNAEAEQSARGLVFIFRLSRPCHLCKDIWTLDVGLVVLIRLLILGHRGWWLCQFVSSEFVFFFFFRVITECLSRDLFCDPRGEDIYTYLERKKLILVLNERATIESIPGQDVHRSMKF